jgi:uncharacterized delta-60 repeat protein
VRSIRIVAATLGLLIAASSTPAAALAGRLDVSFAGTGWTRKALASGQDSGLADVVRGPKGSIVGAGRVGTGGETDMAIVRLRSGGGFDTAFGDGGVTTVNFFGDEDRAEGVARDTHGRIVVAGTAKNAGATQFAIARLRSGGGMDPSFSGDGRQTTNLLGLGSAAIDVAVDGVDRVIAVGYTQSGASEYQTAIVRYRADGTLDPGFSGDGVIFPELPGSTDFAWTVAADAKNRVLAAGSYTTPGDVSRWFVLRLKPGGGLDPTFAGDGIREFGLWPGGVLSDDGVAYAITVTAAGRILVGGYQEIGGSFRVGIARMRSNGTFDPTFSGDGRTAFLADGREAEADAVMVDGKGRAVFVGYTSGSPDLVVGRLRPGGGRDPSFGGNGVDVRNIVGANYGNGAFLDAKGRLVVGGSNYAASIRALVARFLMA